MAVFFPESFVLSLFDNIDDLTDYCMADNQQKAEIIKKVVDRLTQEGKSIPGMICITQRQQ